MQRSSDTSPDSSAGGRPIRSSRTPMPPARLGGSDRPLAAPRVALVPAALAWAARLADRHAGSSRRDPLPDLPDHRLVLGCRAHWSLPGDPADLAGALRW